MAWTYVGAGSAYLTAGSGGSSTYLWNYPASMIAGDVMVHSMARSQNTTLPANWLQFHTGLPSATWSEATGSEPASFTTPVLDGLGAPATEDEYLTLITAWRWTPLQSIRGPLDPWDYTGSGYAFVSAFHGSGDGFDMSTFPTPAANALVVVTGFHTNSSAFGGDGTEPPLTYSPTEIAQATVWDPGAAGDGRGIFHAGIDHPAGGTSPVITVTIPAATRYDGWSPDAYASAVAPGDIPCITTVL